MGNKRTDHIYAAGRIEEEFGLLTDTLRFLHRSVVTKVASDLDFLSDLEADVLSAHETFG